MSRDVVDFFNQLRPFRISFAGGEIVGQIAGVDMTVKAARLRLHDLDEVVGVFVRIGQVQILVVIFRHAHCEHIKVRLVPVFCPLPPDMHDRGLARGFVVCGDERDYRIVRRHVDGQADEAVVLRGRRCPHRPAIHQDSNPRHKCRRAHLIGDRDRRRGYGRPIGRRDDRYDRGKAVGHGGWGLASGSGVGLADGFVHIKRLEDHAIQRLPSGWMKSASCSLPSERRSQRMVPSP
jgi:hypothetical protein